MKLNIYAKQILMSLATLIVVNSAEANYLLTKIPAKELKNEIRLSFLAYHKSKDVLLSIQKEPGEQTYSLLALPSNDSANLYSLPVKKTPLAQRLSEEEVISKIQSITSPGNTTLHEGSFVEIIQSGNTSNIFLVEAHNNGVGYPQKGSIKHMVLCEGMGWVCPPTEPYRGESDSDPTRGMISVLGEHTSNILGRRSCSYITAQDDANLKCINDYKGVPGKRLNYTPIQNSFTVTCQVQIECFVHN